MTKHIRLLIYIIILLFAAQASALVTVELMPEYFPDPTRGRPISSANIYVGDPDTDPTVTGNQKQLSVQQESGTIVNVSQPVTTSAGGVPQYLGSPVTLLVDGDYSLTVTNSAGTQLYYIPSVVSRPLTGVVYLSQYTNFGVLVAAHNAAVALDATVRWEVHLDADDTSSATQPSTMTVRPIIGNVMSGTVIWGVVVGDPRFKWRSGAGHTGDEFSRPEWWGIDGTTDETEIQYCLEAVEAAEGTCILVSSVAGNNSDYVLTSAGITLDADAVSLVAEGGGPVTITTAADIDALTIDGAIRVVLRGLRFRSSHATPTGYGVKLTGATANCKLYDIETFQFKYGFGLIGSSGGVGYNEIYGYYGTNVLNSGYVIHILDGGGSSWANENHFFGGRVAAGTPANTYGNLWYSDDDTTNNKAIGMSFESVNTVGWSITDEGFNAFVSACRLEVDNYGVLVNNDSATARQGTTLANFHWAAKHGVFTAVTAGRLFTDVYSNGNYTARGFVQGGTFATEAVDVGGSASGQAVVNLKTGTTDFYIGQIVVLDEGNANEEWHTVASVQDVTSITTSSNLDNTHLEDVVVTAEGGFRGIMGRVGSDAGLAMIWAGGRPMLQVDGGAETTDSTIVLGQFHTEQSVGGKRTLTTIGTERVMTEAEVSGQTVLVSAAIEVRVPDSCDTGTGARVLVVQRDANETVEIAVTDTNDHFYLNGTDLGANQEIDSPGDASNTNYIELVCIVANEWHSFDRQGTWVDGGAAD